MTSVTHWGPREITLGHAVRDCVERGGGTCTMDDVRGWLATHALEPVTLTELAFVAELVATFGERHRQEVADREAARRELHPFGGYSRGGCALPSWTAPRPPTR